MCELTLEARNRLLNDKNEFINTLGMLRGDKIYEAGFAIAVHSKVYDMIVNGEIICKLLSRLIMTYESPIVNIISGNYVLQGYTDFDNLKLFVQDKIHEMIENY